MVDQQVVVELMVQMVIFCKWTAQSGNLVATGGGRVGNGEPVAQAVTANPGGSGGGGQGEDPQPGGG